MKNIRTFNEFVNEGNEQTIDGYEELVQKYDWYYWMSDDSRAYDAGRKTSDALIKIYKELSPQDKTLAFKAFIKKAPKREQEKLKKASIKKFMGA